MIDEERDLAAEVKWYEQFGTAQEAERVRAELEGRPVNEIGALGMLATGADVPPDQIKPAARAAFDLPPAPGAEEFPNPDDDTPVREGGDVEAYEKWTKTDLIAEAEVRNRAGATIDASLNKEPLIEALRADDEANAQSEE